MRQNKKSFFLLCSLSVLVLLLSRCESNEIIASTDSRGPAFAGSTTCRQCHQQVYDSFDLSTHRNSTYPIFKAAPGVFTFNDSIQVMVQHRDSGYFQAMYVHNKEKEAHRMDIAFGVKHARTFLSWHGDKTFELPLSWYGDNWGTSPGFSSTHHNFNRFIGANCFECHTSFVGSMLTASTKGIEEVLDKNKLIYGIDCERCHGPALQHVNFHLNNPDSKQAKYITKIASLSLQQKLDVCAVCHSGNNKMQERSTFKFRPGDTLSHYFVVWPSKETDTNFDVHGNQYQLLAQSKCFTASKVMNCSTCHNPHGNAGTDLKIYSSICMSCHKNVQHSFTQDASQLVNNCIDCHMPSQPSGAISYQTVSNGPKLAYLLRTHRIAVYAKDAQKH